MYLLSSKFVYLFMWCTGGYCSRSPHLESLARHEDKDSVKKWILWVEFAAVKHELGTISPSIP